MLGFFYRHGVLANPSDYQASWKISTFLFPYASDFVPNWSGFPIAYADVAYNNWTEDWKASQGRS